MPTLRHWRSSSNQASRCASVSTVTGSRARAVGSHGGHVVEQVTIAKKGRVSLERRHFLHGTGGY